MDVHDMSKFLKTCGLKCKKNNKPLKSLIDSGLAKFDKCWLWDESLITSLESFGLVRLRKYKIKNETADKNTAYTDGSRGSYAAVLIENGCKTYIAGVNDDLLDNNRSELFAIKSVLEVANFDLTIYTDSRYAIGAIKKPHLQEKNVDILADIGIITKQKQIDYKLIWIKAHVGIIGNAEADALANFVRFLKL